MSQKYPGGFITKTPTAPTSSAAPGIWTLDQAMQNQKAGNWPSPPSPYIEDWFSTYLYTSTGAAQTITNGIDLSTKGGLVWNKNRTGGVSDHTLFDTARGAAKTIKSNTTDAESNNSTVSAFTTTGFTTGVLPVRDFVSWTFAERQKFFDVVTWTGDGTDNRAITHSLGSVPGCIIVKNTSSVVSWAVKHRSLTASQYLVLNDTAAPATTLNPWSTDPTSSVFYVNGSGSSISNGAGFTYVAYIFAHNSGGFGLTGTDNVISCSSVTTDGSGNATVDLGYEPQFVMIKSLDAGQDWNMVDTMRGLAVSNFAYNGARLLTANTSSAESSAAFIQPSSTGFGLSFFAGSSQTYIYIAIRRGPMKVPTLGTSVFGPVAYTGTGAAATTTTGFVTDLAIIKSRGVYAPSFEDRLRGANRVLESNGTSAEITTTQYVLGFDAQTGVRIGTDVGVNGSGTTYINWAMQRAPGFFDEVCYTGTGVARTVAHNLTVVPELMIVKSRTSGASWLVGSTYLATTDVLFLALDLPVSGGNPAVWNSAYPTASVINLGDNPSVNASGGNFVAYLFATCPGVSKVGTFTGTGATQVINCGFTGGARFVLIKSTSTTGNWLVWDSARGIVAGNDPYLTLNTTAAEVTTTDWVDTAATGFELSNSGGNLANTNGVSYIFLAIA